MIEINVVLPNETEKLKIVKGKDLLTLVTCTPYSVNTHRLLVTGTRDLDEEDRVNREGLDEDNRHDYDKWRLYFIIFVIIAVLVSGWLLHRSRKDVIYEKE